MLDASQIDEIRRITRLEALRAAVFSVASESLDFHIPRLVVVVAFDGESFDASISYTDAQGSVISGGSL
jgi:hypothetical protein